MTHANDNPKYEPAIYITLNEAEAQALRHGGNPIIQQLVYLMRQWHDPIALRNRLAELEGGCE